MNKGTHSIGRSILSNTKQLLLIVFSVVLGIYLSERIEEQKKEKEAALLLSQIKLEVEANRSILERWTPYHAVIVDRLDSLENDQSFIQAFVEDASTIFEVVLTEGNIMGDFPSNDAWDIAKSHPLIVHLDYDKVLLLSRIYRQQEGTYKSVPEMIELFLAADFNSEEKAETNLRTFKNQLREVAGREMQLIRFFDEAEEILELRKRQ
jgi:hypothetical protein